MAMSENSLKVFEYVRAHETENITANDIADALGFEP
jgi:YesN/AraC family two-component response regulator